MDDINEFTPEQVEAIERIMLEEDRLGYGSPKAFSPEITLEWTPVPGAVDYKVYRQSDLDRIKRRADEQRKLRRRANKRKRQARARTGRRK